MSQSTPLPPAGWYPDPAGSGGERYWDGDAWSQVTRPAGGLHAPAGAPQPQPQQSWAQGPHPHGTAPGPYAAGPNAQGPYAPGPYGPWAPGYAGVPAFRLAGFWWRVLAAILDSLVLMVPLGMLQGPIMGDAIALYEGWLNDMLLNPSTDGSIPPLPDGIIGPYLTYVLVSVLVWAAYRIVMVARFGATLGKLATGLRVVRDGDQSLALVGWNTATVRELLGVVFAQIPLLGVVDALAMLFNPKKQTIHDMIAKTQVVKKS